MKIKVRKSEVLRVDWNGRQCVYCGFPAESLDHIPPVSLYQKREHAHRYYRTNYFAVPSCIRCNVRLNDLVIYPINERAALLRDKVEHKYKQLANKGLMTADELKEMGHSLRYRVAKAMLERCDTLDYLRHLSIIASLPTFYAYDYWCEELTDSWPYRYNTMDSRKSAIQSIESAGIRLHCSTPILQL